MVADWGSEKCRIMLLVPLSDEAQNLRWCEGISTVPRKVDVRLTGEGNSLFHGAGPVYWNHLDDQVDSGQLVVNKELPL